MIPVVLVISPVAVIGFFPRQRHMEPSVRCLLSAVKHRQITPSETPTADVLTVCVHCSQCGSNTLSYRPADTQLLNYSRTVFKQLLKLYSKSTHVHLVALKQHSGSIRSLLPPTECQPIQYTAGCPIIACEAIYISTLLLLQVLLLQLFYAF